MSFGGTIGPRTDGEAGQEVAEASDTATGSDRQHGGSGRQSHRPRRRRPSESSAFALPKAGIGGLGAVGAAD